MSVCNFVLTDDRIDVITDTLGYVGKAPSSYRRKVHVHPSLPLAVTTRGLRAFGKAVAKAAFAVTDVGTAEATLVAVLQAVARDGAEDPTCGEGAEVTLFAWNDGPKVVRFMVRGADVTLYRFKPGVYLAPSVGAVTLPTALPVDKLARVSLAQQRVSREKGLNMCIGGQMEHTAITAAGVSVAVLEDYPDRAMTDRQIARQRPEPVREAVACA